MSFEIQNSSADKFKVQYDDTSGFNVISWDENEIPTESENYIRVSQLVLTIK